ncbi:hypothetical protein [Pseudomonas violetae]|uniref:Uncharacterized protein n=1 Tax=Pseudomonas violetae TaxID=2915813 RepID=A0ABT0ESU6_9PSED|nr:hypothetical protein [Pseudomonas violetae]MCK1788808.1 hypothetical protein [Pseudomonas violetae]
MKLRVLAVVVFSCAVLNGAYAAADKNRVMSEARWYTEAYVKEYLSKIKSSFLGPIFHKNVAYSFSGDAHGYKQASRNLLEEPVSIRKGAFLRWPPKESGKNLAMELDDQCVRLIAQGLRGLEQLTRQRLSGAPSKGIIISGIQTGELASAPLDLNQNRSRKILVTPPLGDGQMRCNVYKTLRGGYVTYDVSVVFIATAAYWMGR